MRRPLYDLQARRKTVSVSLNADLVEKARAAGINISRIAEGALATAFAAHEREILIADARAAAALTERLIAEHGPPFRDWTTEGEWPDEEDLGEDAA